MKIAVLAFDGFTDVDLFLPWDFLWRVKVSYGGNYKGPWEMKLCAELKRVTSYSGVTIETTGTLEDIRNADAVFFPSGDGTRAKLADADFMGQLKLNPKTQIVAAIDSGVLLIAKLGLLDGLTATTYPTVFPELEAMGVKSDPKALVVHGNIATGGGCLATQDLCFWMVERLLDRATAQAVLASFQKNVG